MNRQIFFYFCLCLVLSSIVFAADNKPKKKKDIRDFTDEDLDRLYEEWEENDEDVLEEDEKPFYERKQPSMPDLSKVVGG
uniref:Uncharacterized protein n=1 Tax=Panagrolaimus sp. JU765 TaxID=591449 RepID=A0AC34QZP8_9BILA